ncbi:MAG: hypothetical protein ACOCXH_05315 [Cyclobacteriaceae bacterium]
MKILRKHRMTVILIVVLHVYYCNNIIMATSLDNTQNHIRNEYRIEGRIVEKGEFENFIFGWNEIEGSYHCAKTKNGGRTSHELMDFQGIIWVYKSELKNKVRNFSVEKNFLKTNRMTHQESEGIENEQSGDYIREYAPYESATKFLRRQLRRRDKVQLSFVLSGFSDYQAAQALQKELVAWKKNEFKLTLMKVGTHAINQDLSSELPGESQWRISGVSVPQRLPSEKEYYYITGCLWSMAAHFGGKLEACSFRMVN